MMTCGACRAERDHLSPSEAFVMGLVVADLQHRGRKRFEASLCDQHGRFPHVSKVTPDESKNTKERSE